MIFSLFVFFTYGHIWPNLPEWVVYDLKSIFLVFDNCFVCTCLYIHPNTIKIIRVQTYSRFFQIKPKIPSHLTLNDIDRGQSVSAKDPVRRWTRSVETRRYSFVDADISRILKVVVKVLVKIYYILPAVNELREIIRLKMS